jgi:serine/threonine protein kinase
VIRCLDYGKLPGSTEGLDKEFKAVDSVLAMVLEFCDGGSLAGLLSRQMISPHSRLYSDKYAMRMVEDVARALHHTHTSLPPALHRDVKADNVMLTKDVDGKPCTKLIDFGLLVVRSLGFSSSRSCSRSRSRSRSCIIIIISCSGRCLGLYQLLKQAPQLS